MQQNHGDLLTTDLRVRMDEYKLISHSHTYSVAVELEHTISSKLCSS